MFRPFLNFFLFQENAINVHLSELLKTWQDYKQKCRDIKPFAEVPNPKAKQRIKKAHAKRLKMLYGEDYVPKTKPDT